MIVRCPNAECGQAIQIADDFAGGQARCPLCHGAFSVPEPAIPVMAVVLDDVPEEPAPRLRPHTWYTGLRPEWRWAIGLALVGLSILIPALLGQPIAGLFCFGMSFLLVAMLIGNYERLTLMQGKKSRP